jgi:hypothetical protein
MDPWQIDNVYVERSRLQVEATRATIAEMRSVMEESRRILARSQNLLRRIHQKESSAADAGDDNLHRKRVRKAALAHGADHQGQGKGAGRERSATRCGSKRSRRR